MSTDQYNILRKVGYRCGNLQNNRDVEKIQLILNKINVMSPPLIVNGNCDGSNENDPTIKAIKKFQKLWNDYRISGFIEPNSMWYNRLMSLVQPMRVNKVSLKRIDKGGYRIIRDGIRNVPTYYKIFLKLSHTKIASSVYLDISNRPKSNICSTEEFLIKLLEIFDTYDLWTQTESENSMIKVSVVLKMNDIIISESILPRNLEVPVKPIIIKSGIRPDPETIGFGGGDKPLPYGGGTLLYHVPLVVNKKRMFFYTLDYDRFVTKMKDKKLNCSNFVAACLGIDQDANQGSAVRNGWKLTIESHASKTEIWAEEKPKRVINFLKADENRNYTYIVWHPGHCRLYTKGVFHEFTNLGGTAIGYRQTPIEVAETSNFLKFQKGPYWVSMPSYQIL